MFPPSNSSRDPKKEFASLGSLPAHSIVYGLREFWIRPDGLLTGVVYRKPWTPGVNRAMCLLYTYTGFSAIASAYGVGPDLRVEGYNTFPDHSMENCHHGFYAYYDGSTNYHEAFETVGGVIRGWGEAVIGTKGFRVQYAEIMGLVFGEEPTRAQRERVRRQYSNIPIFKTSADLLARFPLTDHQVEEVPDPDDKFWEATP